MRTGAPEDLLRSLKPKQRVFFQGGSGECAAFFNLLKDNPGFANGVELWSCLVPSINALDYGSLPGLSLTTFMASPALEPSIAAGGTRLMVMPYSGIGELLSRTDFDLAILHTAAPDNQGLHSFGICCDTPAIVWPRSERRVAFVNARMPSLAGADSIPADAIDLAIPIDEPLLAPAPPGPRSAALEEIARLAAELVPDGSVIQSGIGDTPAAVVSALRLHRGLRVYSGIITPEYQMLAESGALDMDAERVTGIAWGDAAFHGWLGQSGFAFHSVLETHDHRKMAALPGFVSIGSALEVDLAGNLNLEWRNGRRISSVGGAPDYLRGAAASPGGRSIIALQAASGKGASRIVPSLKTPSIPGELADVIVTEHGVAHLRGLPLQARARALIAIAAPEHRVFLEDAVRRGLDSPQP